MSWSKKLRTFSSVALLVTLCGCGVKGDPLPPEKPTDLGRGRPTYKKAVSDIQKSKDDEDRKKKGKDDEN